MKRALILLITLILTSCSASWHLNKALQKDPGIIVGDTVVTVDTVWHTVATVDTIFKFTSDTVVFERDSVIVKYFYNTRDSTVYIEADCPDCPEIQSTTTLPQVVVKQKWHQKMKDLWWTYLVIIGLFAFLIGRLRG